MSDPLVPIPEFEDRDPIKLWRHSGLDCAIYMGTHSPCGYVRIPEGHPLRAVAESADILYRCQESEEPFRSWLDAQPPGAFGYNGLDDLYAPGDLNFGPTETGWVGFDTAHAFDRWDIEELLSFMAEDDLLRVHHEYLIQHGLHPMQFFEQFPMPYERKWTLEKLEEAVNHLADQVAAVRAEL